jgi:hypothetical protein
MSDQRAVLDEMRRCVPKQGKRLLSVFSEASVRARREWYHRFGHGVVEETSEWLMTAWGLRSELRFLPPYSPDFNPTELAFAKLKAFIRLIVRRD